MAYVVGWWEVESQRHVLLKNEQAALELATVLRKRSDAQTWYSLVPIRVMPQSVFEKMEALKKAGNNTPCKHGLFRLCITCLESYVKCATS